MMVWDNVQALIESQGAVFWGAAVAAALGASMLAAALGVQMRRWREARRPAAPPQRPAVARATSDGYEPASPAAAATESTDAAAAALLARLRSAGDRLAALQERERSGNSRLKPTGQSVDYVFRSGVG